MNMVQKKVRDFFGRARWYSGGLALFVIVFMGCEGTDKQGLRFETLEKKEMSSSVVPQNEKPVFVLVAGAWHGGWAWHKVTKLLRSRGYEVFAPTLTGLGERSHLGTKDVGLEMHIQDICQVIKFESLERVILVGHSYGGLVVEGTADRLPQRIAGIVYLDSYLARNGQSIAFNNLDGRDSEPGCFRVHREFGVLKTPAWLGGREGLMVPIHPDPTTKGEEYE